MIGTPPRLRKTVLLIHLVCSVGWIGAAFTYLALGISAVTSGDVESVRAAWIGMELIGWSVIVPLALATLVTGVVVSVASSWGLMRHYWVVISLVLTAFAVVVTVVHMPTVSMMADAARQVGSVDLRSLGGDLFHPGVGIVVLLVVMALNVYKPRGRTRYGRRDRIGRTTLAP